MKRLLVVDDNSNFSFSLSIGLKRKCYHVDIANDAFEAIDCLQHNRYDVLIADIRMPKLNGIGLSRIASHFYPGIAIILMSAYDFKEFEEQINGLPAVRIAKPFQLSQLTALIEKSGQDAVIH
ncbi:response regulator [candidate division KSB1 bacterium]|nr:response regulator [candidate division KSB1 bacterium]